MDFSKYNFSNILSLRFQYGKVKINHLYVSTCDVSYGRACRIFCRIPHKQTSYLHYACARALANGVFSHKICRILAKCRILLNLSFIIRYKAWQSIPLSRYLNLNQDSLIQFLINQIQSLVLNFNYDPNSLFRPSILGTYLKIQEYKLPGYVKFLASIRYLGL